MKPLTLFRYIQDGDLVWYPHQAVLCRAWLDKLKEGGTVEIRLKKQGRKKTNKQLGYWFSVLLPYTVKGLLEAGYDVLFEVAVGSIRELRTGVETNTDTVDILLKTLYKAHKGLDKLPLKRNMTTEEMNSLIDFSLQWAAENLGIFIPTPEER